MYNFLKLTLVDEKKQFLLYGTLYDNKKNIVERIFGDGIPHEDMGAPYTLILDESESLLKERQLTDLIPSYVSNAGMLFLISPKAQNLFAEIISDDISMYDLDIKGSDFELLSYKIVKVKDKIDCIDLEKSDVDYNEKRDKIRSAEEIVLDENKIPDNKQIFLLGKRSTAIIIVHENLKKTIENAGLTGFKFHNLDEAYMVIS